MPSFRTYYEEHGHVNAPRSEPAIGKLVHNVQRGTVIPPQFSAGIDAMGGIAMETQVEVQMITWEDIYMPAFRKYYEEHGHISAPQSESVIGKVINTLRSFRRKAPSWIQAEFDAMGGVTMDDRRINNQAHKAFDAPPPSMPCHADSESMAAPTRGDDLLIHGNAGNDAPCTVHSNHADDAVADSRLEHLPRQHTQHQVAATSSTFSPEAQAFEQSDSSNSDRGVAALFSSWYKEDTAAAATTTISTTIPFPLKSVCITNLPEPSSTTAAAGTRSFWIQPQHDAGSVSQSTSATAYHCPHRHHLRTVQTLPSRNSGTCHDTACTKLRAIKCPFQICALHCGGCHRHAVKGKPARQPQTPPPKSYASLRGSAAAHTPSAAGSSAEVNEPPDEAGDVVHVGAVMFEESMQLATKNAKEAGRYVDLSTPKTSSTTPPPAPPMIDLTLDETPLKQKRQKSLADAGNSNNKDDYFKVACHLFFKPLPAQSLV